MDTPDPTTSPTPDSTAFNPAAEYESLTAGGMPGDAAEKQVTAKLASLSKADQWDALTGGGMDPDKATKWVNSHTALASGLSHAVNALTFNFGPKIAGLIDKLRGGNYAATRDAEQASLDQQQAAHPISSAAGDVAGGVSNPAVYAIPGLGEGGIVSSIKAAAGLGALSGVGAGRDTPGDYATNIAEGAGGGAIGGAIGHGVSRLLGAGAKSAADIADNIIRSKAPTLAAGAEAAGAGALGLHAYPEGARAVATAFPDAANVLASAAKERNAAIPQAVQDALETATGQERGSLTRTPQQLIDLRSQAAASSYPEALNGTTAHPDVINTLRDIFPAEYAKGAKLAAKDGIAMPALTDPSGAVKQILAKYGDDPELVKQLQAGGAIPAENAAVPLRGFDYVKQIIDDRVGAAKRAGNLNEARILTKAKNGMLSWIDASNPEYANARATFSGNSAMLDAYKTGAEHFATTAAATPDEVADAIKKMTPGEQIMYRRGVLDQTMQRIENAAGSAEGGADPTRVFRATADRDKFAAALGPKQYDTFSDAMQSLVNQRRASTFLTNQSATAEKQVAAQALRDAVDKAIGKAPMGATDMFSAALHPGRALMGAIAKGVTSKMNEGASARAQQIGLELANRYAMPIDQVLRLARSAPPSRWADQLAPGLLNAGAQGGAGPARGLLTP